jgi:formylglycine-generating enzyme required for sulfatase activity
MAEVFISYKKEDSASAERVAAGLREAGFAVWWDNELTPRMAWDAMLEREIEQAVAVVVLWTPRSVHSEWVRTEAHYGQDRGKLVPALIERCELPIAFMLRQTVDLTAWNGDRSDRNWRKLLTWIADLRAHAASAVRAPGDAGAPANPYRDVVGRLPSGAPVVDGAFVNASTPAGTAFRDADGLPVMRIVARGEFMLGSPPSDRDRSSTEEPQRRVEIPRPFAIGAFPVLGAQYQKVMGEAVDDHAPRTKPTGLLGWFGGKAAPGADVAVRRVPDHPVTHVSYDDAEAFAERLSAATGERYRIPSEAEWEYACRAGSRSRYACGDSIGPGDARFGNSEGPVAPGAYPPNAFGLYDMHGNVREWTADVWHESYDATPLDGSPATQGHSAMRVVRGGSWSDDAVLLRSAARMRATPTSRVGMIGFRVVRELA